MLIPSTIGTALFVGWFCLRYTVHSEDSTGRTTELEDSKHIDPPPHEGLFAIKHVPINYDDVGYPQRIPTKPPPKEGVFAIRHIPKTVDEVGDFWRTLNSEETTTITFYPSPPRQGIFGLKHIPVNYDDVGNLKQKTNILEPPSEGVFALRHLPASFQDIGNVPKCDETTSHIKIKNSFSYIDYTILSLVLMIACGVGLFYGCLSGNSQSSSSDYLLGGGTMGTLPTALSLAFSFITAIELLGNPAEMYNHGAQFWMMCFAFVAVIPLTSRLYLPVFMNLRLTSSYEYLSLRFSNSTRYLASGLYILQMTLYTSVAVYAPALALSNVTGLNVYVAVTMVYVVCIFYASQGGMKAVIIADTFLAIVLIASLLAILTIGEYLLGGNGVIWSTSYDTDRLQIFNLDPDPTIRHSFWSVTIGGTFYWLTMFCANQASIQKYLSVQKISQARTALWISCFFLVFTYTVNFYTGMIMLAEWKDCDPITSGDAQTSDQLLPLYVINILGQWQGVPGFFTAGIFAASLGTVATALNSLAAVTTEDFIQGAFGLPIKNSKAVGIAKWISFFYGIASFGLVFIVERMGGVMQLAVSFNGMVGGVTLGLFSLGMFFPWANSKGAMLGAMVASALVLTMSVGSQFKQASGDIVYPIKSISVDKCECFNQTHIDLNERETNLEISILYRISYLWYSLIGCIVTIVIGLITSFCTNMQEPKELNQNLISPGVNKIYNRLPNDWKEFLHLPLKTAHSAQKNIVLTGIVNLTLDVEDERITVPKSEEVMTNSGSLQL